MSQTRTGPTVKKLVGDIQADLADVVEKIKAARAMLSELEGETKGVNGLSSILRAKGGELDKMTDDLKEESEAVHKKLLGSGPEIVQSVNPDQAAKAVTAKGA